jgi:DNA polymerase-3 subunit gamma/tau
MPADETQLLYSLCLHGRTELGLAPDEYAAMTMVLLRLLAFKPKRGQETTASANLAEKKTLTPAVSALNPPAVAQQAAAPSTVTSVSATTPAPATSPVATLAKPQAALQAKRQIQVAEPQTEPQTPSAWDHEGAEDTSSPFVDLPIQIKTLSVREASEPTPRTTTKVLVPTEEGDFWTETVRALVSAEAITALVRELALQSQLIGRDTDQWHLRIESESLNQGTARDRLQTALNAAGHSVKLMVEIGKVTDSPAQRNAAALAEKQKAAEDLIHSDPLVQAMVQDFGAKIVPGSIKLIS